MGLRFETKVEFVKGVGPKLGELFNHRGLHTVGDLLRYFPRTYEDRKSARGIANLQPMDSVVLRCFIVSVNSFILGRSHKKIYDVLVKDSTGSIHCKFFRIPYKGFFERLSSGLEVQVIGRVIDYRGKREFHHPDIQIVEASSAESLNTEDQLIPLYSDLDWLGGTKISKIIGNALEAMEVWPEGILPLWTQEKFGLLSLQKSFQEMHRPKPTEGSLFLEGKSPAQRRFIFEEFFLFEISLLSRKRGLQKQVSLSLEKSDLYVAPALRNIPFSLTGAQQRAFQEICKDMGKKTPMNRLVQGDVGCGKTMVALLAALVAVEGGAQACLMAPTEILAEQHARNAERTFTPLGLKVALLTGKTKKTERTKMCEDLQMGVVHLLVGTHALLEDWVQFKQLGLVVVDEQHRFGVHQRGNLKSKGLAPHFLLMTATPIPRTLALTVYGDLDVSIIDEMPPGRSPIQTRLAGEKQRELALQFMAEQVQKGRQAYIIYPLVEESEVMDLKDAISHHEDFKKRFPQWQVGLLHGKMKPQEKQEIMESFRTQKIQILVSTTVVEVGVDIPNANIILIEHAERFGLSQLHQLRGRVGRGEHKSFCILLMGPAVSEVARQRLAVMESTQDGFKIAEFDLEQRGIGELMGSRQSGLSGFKIAHLVRDVEILLSARDAAAELLQKDPDFKKVEHQVLKGELQQAQEMLSI